MKNRLKTFLVVAGTGLVLFGSVVALLTSCGTAPAGPKPVRVEGGNIQVIKFEGHEYLSFDGDNYNGGVCHSESCPCKSK
jgi:hypothetical protein